ncbi:fumarylacetoacetate hydrolase family protein [Jiangella sp. DSM 45060]|uniref:fumarylacetoacetate hydrolase family protein n=1 Tax=Jiangella sp. DSM 45060 TaxID=1798224 RepID=UPI00087ACCE3|nr:fumarylacetoacetate hydrolase family protein [Jiangella sp. DSM 45060]SDT47591.1 2-keto-4-pentenoate hydratase/2-oxohepta-3-ene-1,7-dioic acid hydratase (catechol pathway) [Jiangella sp. DSM 45060]
MRLASYLADGVERWGFVVDEPTTGQAWVVEPARAEAFLARYASIPSSGLVASRPRFRGDDWPATLVEFLALEDEGMAALSRLVTYVERFVGQSDATLLPRAGSPVDDVELLAPVPRPRLYWGLVANAPSFVRNKPGIPIVNLFPLGHQRPQGAAIGPGAPVTFRNGHHLPLMAYNVELAVVIGRAGRYIPLERAMEHVAGYTVVNDVSGTYYYDIVPGNAGRGYSLPEGYSDWLYQVTASWGGKKADTLAPMGPFLVTKDEVGDPYDLLMYTRQTGRTRDRAHSGATLLGIERVISWYSSFASLYPGDVLHFATMGVDGLPVSPGDVADPRTLLEVEIEDVGTLVNPVAVAEGPVPLESHPSYAVRQVAASGASSLESPQAWTPGSARHFYTSFGNHETAAEVEGLARLEVPRFLNGPASSLGISGPVEIPPRATHLVVGIELAVVIRALAAEAQDGREFVLGYAPLISVCDRSFADAVVEPARTGERGIPAMYGRWADGFNVVGSLAPLPDHDWRGRAMSLTAGSRAAAGPTSEYLAGPDELIRTISAMITLFPGDVITLGSTAARLVLTRDEYEAGVVVRGGIEGLGEVYAEIAPSIPATR